MKYLVVSNRHLQHTTYFPSPEALEDYLKVNLHINTLIFAFWSWKVEAWMLKQYTCYGLHTGPLLEGRGKGGSPIDNLKKLGVKWTTLCAFDMTGEIDGGRVRLAIPINIEECKAYVVGWISGELPYIVSYLTAEQPEIPERFTRI